MSKLLAQINTVPTTNGTLGSFVDLIGGGTPKTTVKEYWNGDIPWLSVVDFNNDTRWVSDAEKKITIEGVNNSATRILNKDDIIISARGTVGALAQLTHPMAFNQSCYGIRAKSELDQSYLFYLLKSSIPKLTQIVHGAVFDTITKDSFEQINVSIPSLSIQKKIASILSAYDAKIENNNKIIKNLEATAQTIFNEWFVNFKFPAYEKVKMVESEMGEIPEGWEFGSVKNIFEINPPTKVAEIVDVPYVEMRDLSESNMTFCFEQKRKPTNGSRFKNHDTLMARITPCLENGKTGYVNCLEDMEVGVGSTEFLVLRPKKFSFREFTYVLARNATFRSFAIGRMIGSSGRQRVSGEDIGRYQFVKPISNVIDKFHEIIAPMFNLVKAYSEENISLKSRRDQLLAKLI